jgi:IS5 family transposase
MAANTLICGDEAAVLADKAAVLADKADKSMGRQEALAEAGITDRIMHRRQAGKRQPTLRRLLPASLAEVGSSVC